MNLRVIVFAFCLTAGFGGALFAQKAAVDSSTFSYKTTTLRDKRIQFSTEISVLSEPKQVRVVFGKGQERFAESILRNSALIIPAIAEYLQIAPSRDTYTITDLTDKSTARNIGGTVLIPFNYPDPLQVTPVPLLFHEIGHWWFGQNPRFMSEGVSSFLPIALHKAGLLQLGADEVLAIENWWGFYVPTVQGDEPLGDDESTKPLEADNFALNYQKTFKIQYLIYNELGADKYLQFLKSLKDYDRDNEEWVLGPEGHDTTSAVLAALQEVKEANWKQLLSGWILSKRYTGISIAEWQDNDVDGPMDIQERYLRTSPKNPDSDADGMPDGAEVALGTDPLKKNFRADFLASIEERGPVLDGSAAEWEFLTSKKTVFSPPNPKAAAEYDLVEFSYYWKGNDLYGMLRTPGKPVFGEANKGYYYFFVDASEKAATEGFGFWFAPDARIGWEARKTGPAQLVQGRVGEVFEFKITVPESDPRPKKLVPLLRKTDNYGIWDGYRPIVVESAE